MVVIQAPVLSPRYSTILAARGIEVCTQPLAPHNTSTWRRVRGVAIGLSGNAAIIAEMSDGFANCFCGQPWLNPPLNPSGGQGFADWGCCAQKTLHSDRMAPHAAMLHFFMM